MREASERERERECVFIPQSNIFMNVTNSPDYVCGAVKTDTRQ